MIHPSAKAAAKKKQQTKPIRLTLALLGIVFALIVVWGPRLQFDSLLNSISTRSASSCTKYALMLDAGSTGSRIHVYRFRQCTSTEDIQLEEEELFEQTIPGLSAYAGNPQKAAESLDVLLDAAKNTVPPSMHSRTPISVKATAGLRLLGTEASEAILDAVYHHLATYPFPIVEGRAGVAIMDGRDEGVYAWITVNFLLGNLKNDTHETAAILDLGGGSVQIVFEPSDGVMVREGEHRYRLLHDGIEHILYQHSYLGYGLMEARKRMHQWVIDQAEKQTPIHSPCLPRDLEWQLSKGAEDVLFVGRGSYEDCFGVADGMLNKKTTCAASPCSFDGIHQPPIALAFDGPIYVFSYFHDRTQPLGLPSSFHLPELETLTQKVCSGELLATVTDSELRAEMLDRPEWCLDLSYIYRLLSHGYEIPNDRLIHVAKKIGGVETGWCLGAAIALLDSLSNDKPL